MQEKNTNPSNEKNGQGNGNDRPDKGDKKINLTIIVSGTPTVVEANPKQKLQVIAQKALDSTGNKSRPLSDWTLKTRDGVVLDMNNTVESYGLVDGDQLFLTLEAGAGG
ncbi:uncharacterized protein DUF2604 [Lacibacter cauensis]|uniref:Uncharacterized protein DUF2604 n=1 Tax=Lacibacter cauensis TaxID=510947 RepID=A0A562S9D4_9BACT|nr:DUF2604 domain-containing protein [Lacibacter cauensis]TWI77949.1 uncharacterized protein DUF2604 [Lacibacter cauensis]